MSVDCNDGQGTSKDARYNHMVTKLEELSTSQNPNKHELNNGEPVLVSQKGKPVPTEEESESDSDTSDTDDESSDEEPIRAPIELLSEFLQYVRTGYWEDAAKLCKMILIYEPDNQEALQFGPLIEEKFQIEKELAEEESEESSEEESSGESENEGEENEDNDEESSSGSEDEEDRTQHLPNRLVFLHEEKIWKP
uniref:Glutamate-rich protein 2-like n=1 Tax=Phallusia mammillata TaxID=59560 RepID=A0A6F9D9G6_9ASCI|nr:glutamate-rich protein 2-like [Phallusia mammillata]